jgi:hypothetical protein
MAGILFVFLQGMKFLKVVRAQLGANFAERGTATL